MSARPPNAAPPPPSRPEGSFTTILALAILMFLMGLIAAMQPAVNALLATRSSGLSAALISFAVGTGVLLVIAVATRSLSFQNLGGTTWWWFVGGLMGAAFVYASLRLVPLLGSAGVISAAVAGQLIGSLLIDHFGWFGLPQTPVSATRVLGIVLLAAGAVLVVRR